MDNNSKAESKSYEFDGFMDIDTTPKSDVSLFERKIRDNIAEDERNSADESWAEMLIEDEDDTPQLGVPKAKTDEQLADEELFASHAVNTEQEDRPAVPPAATNTAVPGLMFSLVEEKDEQVEHQPGQQRDRYPNDDFILSDELARIPSTQGFNQTSAPNRLDPSLSETPDEHHVNE